MLFFISLFLLLLVLFSRVVRLRVIVLGLGLRSSVHPPCDFGFVWGLPFRALKRGHRVFFIGLYGDVFGGPPQ